MFPPETLKNFQKKRIALITCWIKTEFSRIFLFFYALQLSRVFRKNNNGKLGANTHARAHIELEQLRYVYVLQHNSVCAPSAMNIKKKKTILVSFFT